MKKRIKKDIKREIKWAIEDGHKNQYEHYKKLLKSNFYVIEVNDIENMIGYKIFFQYSTTVVAKWAVHNTYFNI